MLSLENIGDCSSVEEIRDLSYNSLHQIAVPKIVWVSYGGEVGIKLMHV